MIQLNYILFFNWVAQPPPSILLMEEIMKRSLQKNWMSLDPAKNQLNGSSQLSTTLPFLEDDLDSLFGHVSVSGSCWVPDPKIQYKGSSSDTIQPPTKRVHMPMLL